MRKTSEVIALAIAKPHYDPTFTGLSHEREQYVCVLLRKMHKAGEITDKEYITAQTAIRDKLGGQYTLPNYLGRHRSRFDIPREEYMQFWDDFIKELQSQDR